MAAAPHLKRRCVHRPTTRSTSCEGLPNMAAGRRLTPCAGALGRSLAAVTESRRTFCGSAPSSSRLEDGRLVFARPGGRDRDGARRGHNRGTGFPHPPRSRFANTRQVCMQPFAGYIDALEGQCRLAGEPQERWTLQMRRGWMRTGRARPRALERDRQRQTDETGPLGVATLARRGSWRREQPRACAGAPSLVDFAPTRHYRQYEGYATRAAGTAPVVRGK